MTNTEFNQLPFEDKLGVIRESGRFIDECDTVYERMSLYVVDHFFVEITYFPTIHHVTSVKALTQTDDLEKYLPTTPLEVL